ncbi:MAG: lytic transglycosylase F [Phycisphaerales bacterium]|nr:lytic transglycosylase F [Phycisphaerales bacterium]
MNHCVTMLAMATPLVALALGGHSPTCAATGIDADQSTAAPDNTHAEDLIARLLVPQHGDLPEMRKSGIVRVLVEPSPTRFFLGDRRLEGFEADLLRELEKQLQKGQPKGDPPLRLVYIPMPLSDLLPALVEGKGDIAAAGLTVTAERTTKVAFTTPYLNSIDEVVVTSATITPPIRRLEDLAGRVVHVPAGSSFEADLRELSEQFHARRLSPPEVRLAPEGIGVEDLLQMANRGVIECTVADSHVARAWAEVLPNVRVLDGVVLRRGGTIAWAVRRNAPKLLAAVNAFVATAQSGTKVGNILFRRYFQSDPSARRDSDKAVRDFVRLAQRIAPTHGLDPYLLAAQAFRESRLDQSARSARGAVGVMQLRPSTAREMGVKDISTIESNVEAGALYLAWLRDKWFGEVADRPFQQANLVLAAYNAGPGRVRDWRRLAKRRGLDPDRWFGGVEMVAIEQGVGETVGYVRDVNRAYLVARLLAEMRVVE